MGLGKRLNPTKKTNERFRERHRKIQSHNGEDHETYNEEPHT